jgi:NB-ARC domain
MLVVYMKMERSFPLTSLADRRLTSDHGLTLTLSEGFKFGLNITDAPDIEQSLFVGRGEDLEKMMDLLSPESDSLVRRVVILGGLGGIGKTQLAIAYIKRHGSSYESVFWLNASSDATLKGSFRSLAVRAGIVDLRNEQLDDDQVRVRVLNWFSMPDNHRWLLVFDNHDDLEQYNIKQHYPYASHGSIVVTSRSPELLSGSHIHVDKLRDLGDALRILTTRSRRDNVEKSMTVSLQAVQSELTCFQCQT